MKNKEDSHHSRLLEKKEKVEEDIKRHQVLFQELSQQLEKEKNTLHVLSGALQAYDEVLASGALT